MSTRPVVLALALLGAPAAAPAQRAPLDISYQVAMREPASHLYDVEIAVGSVAGAAIRLQMPVWSPGRYARMDFAKNTVRRRARAGGTSPRPRRLGMGDREATRRRAGAASRARRVAEG